MLQSRHNLAITRRDLPLQALESRAMLSVAPWNDASGLMGQDQLADLFPTINGAGQVVAIIDTGIDYTNPRLGGGFGPGFKVIAGHDFVDNDSDPRDTNGHGTAVAGMVAADPYEVGGRRYQGIAPTAKLVALRINADTDSTPNARIAEALQWVIDRRSTLGITVVNISFGTGHFDSPPSNGAFASQLAELASAGVIVTAASGNGGISIGPGVDYPAADPNTIAVGSVDEFDSIAGFTERGKLLDILAPGRELATAWLGDTTRQSFGTSFSAPIVAGTAALLKQINPATNLAEVRSILQAGGEDNLDGDSETGPVTNRRFSRLDIPTSLRLAQRRLPANDPSEMPNAPNTRASSIQIDRHGVLHAAYYDAGDARLLYATRSPDGLWSQAINVDSSPIDAGRYVSLSLDSAGRPGIAYFDATNGDLKFARSVKGQFVLATLDARQSVGLYPSTQFDKQNRPAVAYYHKTKGDLRFAAFDGSNWRISDIDADAADRGRSATMAVNSIGRFGVAYEDSTTGKLKVARQTAVGWLIDTIDNDTAGVSFMSAAFDSTDKFQVSYYDATPADLKFAVERSFGGYRTVTIASRGAVGLYSQLLIDGDNNAQILYYSRRDDALFLAAGNVTNFVARRIEAGAGRFTSAATDARDGSIVYGHYRSGTQTFVIDSTFG